MNLKTCIRNAYNQGALSKEERADLERRLAQLIAEIPDARRVQETLATEIAAMARERARIAHLAEEARERLMKALFAHRNARGEQDVAEAFLLHFGHNGEGRMQDVENLRTAILAEFHSEIADLMLTFEKGWLTGDKRRTSKTIGNKALMAQLDNVVRELFGENTGDARAKAMAATFSKVQERARQEFNALGGNIGKLEKYGLAQWHDPEALLNFKKQPWVERLMTPGVLDRERMINQSTGQRLTDAELREALEVSWERITSSGWYDRKVTATPTGRGALYKQHQDHRFIHFANADEWLKYTRDFSNGDPFAAMMGHLDSMSRDLAAMTVFGPNPTAMITYMSNVVESHLKKARPAMSVREEQRVEIDTLTRALVASTGRDGWDAVYADLMRSVTSTLDTISRTRKTALGPRPPGMLALPAPASPEIKQLLARLDTAEANFNTWLDSNPRPPEWDSEGTGRMSDVEQIAARERIRELVDDLRAEVLMPTGDWRNTAAVYKDRAEQRWAIYTGKATSPVDLRLANAFQTARNVMNWRLGSAIVSAVTDTGFQRVTRAFIGIERSGYGSILKDATQMLRQQTREEMIRSGAILDSSLGAVEVQARYGESMRALSTTGYLVDRTMALSGLSAWTQAMKWAFSMEFQGYMADHRSMAWDELPDKMRRSLDMHGFTSSEWDQIRSVPVHTIDARAAGILRPKEIAEQHGDELARKYLMMMFRERRRAVPEPNNATRAFMTQGLKPGTWLGEGIRSGGQFKSFGVTVLLLHGGRAMQEMQTRGAGAGLGYAASILVSTTLLGAIALQLKELIAGRDPRPMDTAKFWGAAALQGGGLGIMGDFLNSSQNRFGGSLGSTIAGPLAGEVEKVMQYTLGNLTQAAEGKDTNIGRETADALRRLTPGASLAWTRLATERLIFDRVQRLIDPDFQDAIARRARNRKREYGNELWWEQGKTEPTRLPRLSVTSTP